MINILNKNITISKKEINIIVNIFVIIGALFVPTFLSKIFSFGKYTQIITGSIVNTALILSAIYFKGTTKILSVITLPSVSTMLSGILFSGLTIYTKSMIPFIWIGNFILVSTYKYLFVSKKLNYALSSIIAIISKAAAIFLGFLLLNQILHMPNAVYNVLSTSMGYIQIITATIASIIVYIIKFSLKSK